jgi:ABC-2 type transport system permease protein
MADSEAPLSSARSSLRSLPLRYLRLFAIQLRASLLLMMQYRVDFFVDVGLSVFWVVVSLVPLLVLFAQRASVAGWSWPEALLVVGWFTLLKGVLEGAIQPALQAVVEHIRTGTLDFLLLKPVDAQFMVSTARFELGKTADLLSGVLIILYGLHRLHHVPEPGAVLVTLALLLAAVLILYSIWILVVSLAFFVVKVDNLSYLFASIYDAARWPASVFRGVLSFIFTFIIPLAVMTTFPALSLLSRLSTGKWAAALAGALLFAALARQVWLGALRRYTSAGG